MEHIDILNRIVEVEHKAQEIANEAKRKSAVLPSELKEEREQMRRVYSERAEKRIKILLRQEEELADEQVALLDRELKENIELLRQHAEKNHNGWVEKLFHMIVSS